MVLTIVIVVPEPELMQGPVQGVMSGLMPELLPELVQGSAQGLMGKPEPELMPESMQELVQGLSAGSAQGLMREPDPELMSELMSELMPELVRGLVRGLVPVSGSGSGSARELVPELMQRPARILPMPPAPVSAPAWISMLALVLAFPVLLRLQSPQPWPELPLLPLRHLLLRRHLLHLLALPL
ncbi:MAG: hypothetical protein VKJ44_06300 [Synechococcus sp.]|nr:hypothetical protein [Synechococcus sp.]